MASVTRPCASVLASSTTVLSKSTSAPLTRSCIANAAAIAARHKKWDERPVLIAIKAEGANPSVEDIRAFYDGKIASWQVPDTVIFVDALPLGGTGKVLKNKLREAYGDVLIDDAS